MLKEEIKEKDRIISEKSRVLFNLNRIVLDQDKMISKFENNNPEVSISVNFEKNNIIFVMNSTEPVYIYNDYGIVGFRLYRFVNDWEAVKFYGWGLCDTICETTNNSVTTSPVPSPRCHIISNSMKQVWDKKYYITTTKTCGNRTVSCSKSRYAQTGIYKVTFTYKPKTKCEYGDYFFMNNNSINYDDVVTIEKIFVVK